MFFETFGISDWSAPNKLHLLAILLHLHVVRSLMSSLAIQLVVLKHWIYYMLWFRLACYTHLFLAPETWLTPNESNISYVNTAVKQLDKQLYLFEAGMV